MSRPDVVVLGAGPAGLAAGWELAERGASVLLVEAAPRVGGMAGTVERDGYRFDYGGHRFLTRWPELLERVTKLMGDDLLLVDRQSVVVHRGLRVGYPLELPDLLRRVPWSRAARYVTSYLGERIRRPARDESTFEGWMARRFGPALYAEFFAPYTRKLWGLDPSRLSSDWAPQRIGTFDLGFALRRLFGPSPREPRTYARRFLYPRLGMGQLFDAIGREIERRGGRILTGTPAIGLSLEGLTLRAVRVPGAEIEGERFVSTLPLPDLLRFLGLETRLRFRGMRFLNVMLDAPADLGSTWAYLSDGEGEVTRVQEPARRSPFMVPPGRGSLQLEIPASVGQPLWALDDSDLMDRAWEEVRRAGIRPRGSIAGFFATRLGYAYPLAVVGSAAEVAGALRLVGEIGNLRVCGRQGRFSYVFSDRAMEQGIAAARQLLGVGGRPPSEAEPCLTESTSLLG